MGKSTMIKFLNIQSFKSYKIFITERNIPASKALRSQAGFDSNSSGADDVEKSHWSNTSTTGTTTA